MISLSNWQVYGHQFSRTACASFLRASRIVLILIIFSSVLSGCAYVSGAGPFKSKIESSSQEEGYELIAITSGTITPFMRAAPTDLTNSVSRIPAAAISLVPGDVVKVLISDSVLEGGVFAPLSAGGTVFNSVRLDDKGNVSLPYAGLVNLGGKSLTEAETVLKKRLGGVTTDPQVHIELVGDLSGSVLVAGAVKTPGRFSASQGALTLLDAINMAGGPVFEPHLVDVVVRTGSTVYSLNYEDILSGKNRPVPPRSEIVVERARKRFVAMGAVAKPGLLDLPSANPSLLEALSTAGGISEGKANPSGVFVFRLSDPEGSSGGTPQVFQLDMRSPAAIFLARRFLILPEDAVYVTNAAVYEWQKIISPIVQALVLGRTFDSF